MLWHSSKIVASAVLMLSIFVLMIPKTAYSAYIPVFLKALGFDNAASMMQIGIACEVIFMFLLSFFLLKAGFKIRSCWAPFAGSSARCCLLMPRWMPT
jgi:hypothetical protein